MEKICLPLKLQFPSSNMCYPPTCKISYSMGWNWTNHRHHQASRALFFVNFGPSLLHSAGALAIPAIRATNIQPVCDHEAPHGSSESNRHCLFFPDLHWHVSAVAQFQCVHLGVGHSTIQTIQPALFFLENHFPSPEPPIFRMGGLQGPPLAATCNGLWPSRLRTSTFTEASSSSCTLGTKPVREAASNPVMPWWLDLSLLLPAYQMERILYPLCHLLIHLDTVILHCFLWDLNL